MLSTQQLIINFFLRIPGSLRVPATEVGIGDSTWDKTKSLRLRDSLYREVTDSSMT